MEESIFKQKMQLVMDPYFDREFFTNLIHCLDRKKTGRDLFDEAMLILSSDSSLDNLDQRRAMLQLFYSLQASGQLRQGYHLLPLFQGLYSTALFRGDGQKPAMNKIEDPAEAKALTMEEFKRMVRRECRPVEPLEEAWKGFLFLVQNRTTRSEALEVLLKQAIHDCDGISLGLLAKGIDLCFASNWKKTSIILRKPFVHFWKLAEAAKTSDTVLRGYRLAASVPVELKADPHFKLSQESPEEFWKRLTEQTAESAWEYLVQLAKKGASLEQLQNLMDLARGRLLFTMKSDQWPLVCKSILYSDALASAQRWAHSERLYFLAIGLQDLYQTAQWVARQIGTRPTGKDILDGVSKNIAKDRLIFRLDDAVERGAEGEAFEVLAVILQDKGLSHTLADRLLLMASKQDAWTFNQTTLAVSFILTSAFQLTKRFHVDQSLLAEDAILGLLRLLSDRRRDAIESVRKTGTYGDRGVSLSQYDVQSGARIVDRFVFNQARNAQRIFVWSEANGL